ncbi:hypothetical protein SETIT_3G034500v2 [Setaria italica]|uniref:Uncharacterized protein n=1 Tax=Setaria italica TaxID=4555 RepID=A0A368QAY0_SETIT|nr:hypothetical protein SETIT_3G034500v2 [Setaria italica]
MATAVILRTTSSCSYGSGGSAAAMTSGSPAAGEATGPDACAAVAVVADVEVCVIGGGECGSGAGMADGRRSGTGRRRGGKKWAWGSLLALLVGFNTPLMC